MNIIEKNENIRMFENDFIELYYNILLQLSAADKLSILDKKNSVNNTQDFNKKNKKNKKKKKNSEDKNRDFIKSERKNNNTIKIYYHCQKIDHVQIKY